MGNPSRGRASATSQWDICYYSTVRKLTCMTSCMFQAASLRHAYNSTSKYLTWGGYMRYTHVHVHM